MVSKFRREIWGFKEGSGFKIKRAVFVLRSSTGKVRTWQKVKGSRDSLQSVTKRFKETGSLNKLVLKRRFLGGKTTMVSSKKRVLPKNVSQKVWEFKLTVNGKDRGKILGFSKKGEFSKKVAESSAFKKGLIERRFLYKDIIEFKAVRTFYIGFDSAKKFESIA